jgi:glycosyltransferase involved in cell wall biosynthesis
MKIVHINTYDRGGAAIACIRLHLSLIAHGIDSHIIFLQRFENKHIPNSVVFPAIAAKKKSFIKRLLNKLLPSLANRWNNDENIKRSIRTLIPETVDWFSFPDTGIDITSHHLYKEADVINLHWASDFLDYSFFEKNKKPVVWTLHDMNAFTGGCHYSFSCEKFKENCLDCPQLQSIKEKNYSASILSYKEKFLLDENKTIVVSPSVWLYNQIKKSKILKNQKTAIIPYGLNSQAFKPHDRSHARQLLGLPMDKRIILFVSSYLLNNKRKGYSLLTESLSRLTEFSKDTALCVVGGKSGLSHTHFETFEYSHVMDENSMSLYYAACDLFVIPSIEDNLPNTVMESLMCGTPVVGYKIGGIPDMIENGENGYLAEVVAIDSLASAIRKWLSNTTIFNRNEIRDQAIKKYDSSIQAQAYISLYKKSLE